MTNSKNSEVPGTEPEGKPVKLATEIPSKRPLWSRNINRVQCAVWSNEQGGRTRYSISIFREYLDRKNNEMKRVHSFDFSDLDDLRTLTKEAKEYVLSLQLPERVGDAD